MSMTTAPNNVNRLKKFLKAQPKTLGAVQIMTGVMTVLLGTINGFSLSIAVVTGTVYWGSIIFIIAGSLTIAAEKKLNPRMVKASLGVNVISAITSGIAVLIFAFEVQYALFRQYEEYESACAYILRLHSAEISGLLLVLSFLQFIISIFLSSFACKAICFCPPQGVDLSPNEQFYSLPAPLTNCSSTADYVNVNMTVVNGHRALPPTPRDTNNQKDDTEYEQPTYN